MPSLMFTDCPSCSRTYQVSRAALGCSGRTVVCPSCSARWYVAVPDTEDLAPRFAAAPEMAEAGKGHRASPVPRRLPGISIAPAVASLACLLLASGLIGKRAAIVRTAPRMAAVYAEIGLPVNVRGLALGDMKTAWPEDGVSRVAISGRIRNVLPSRTAVPRLAFALRDAKGAVLASWSETPPKRTLAANETVPFTAAQVPAMPEGARDVVVRFIDVGRDHPTIQASRP